MKNKKIVYGLITTILLTLAGFCLYRQNQEAAASTVFLKNRNNMVMKIGEEFIISAADLEPPMGDKVGDMKLRLVSISDDSIMVDILGDKKFDGNFYPRDEVEKKEIKTESCIFAFPLVMDVSYKYCFEITKMGLQLVLEYKVEGKSTMPLS